MNKIQSYKELKDYIKHDLYRYMTSISNKSFLRAYFIPGFRYTFWLRFCQWSKTTENKILFLIGRYLLYHYSIKYGIIIPYQTTIGKGLYIGHFSCIVVNPNSIIGENVNISQGVTIGQKNGGLKSGYPVIGNRVYIAAGAKVIGNCRIGNDAVIGANCVVTKSINDNAVVVGIPMNVVSYNGSSNYVGSFLNII